MSIDDAVKVLNEWRHGDIDNWRIDDDFVVGDFGGCPTMFEHFEAIAIAEKLKRDAGRDMLVTREFMRSLEAWAIEAGTDRCYDNGTVDIVIKATIGELRALLGEWGRKA